MYFPATGNLECRFLSRTCQVDCSGTGYFTFKLLRIQGKCIYGTATGYRYFQLVYRNSIFHVKHDAACQVKFDLVVRRQLAVYIEFFCTGQIYLLQLPGIGGNGELGRTEAECFIFSFRADDKLIIIRLEIEKVINVLIDRDSQCRRRFFLRVIENGCRCIDAYLIVV